MSMTITEMILQMEEAHVQLRTVFEQMAARQCDVKLSARLAYLVGQLDQLTEDMRADDMGENAPDGWGSCGEPM